MAFIWAAGTGFAAEIKGNTAVLGALDKITGRVSSIEAKVGETVKFLSLDIKIFACYYKPPEEAPDNVIFLNIKERAPMEKSGKISEKQYFNGWMYSSSPAISALEHPIYDIWSIECKNIAEEEPPQAE